MNKDLVEKIFKRLILCSLPLLIFFLIFTENIKSNVSGYLFGMLISMTNFLLLKKSVEKSVKMDPASANRYAIRQYLLRMSISGLVLVIGAVADYLNFLALVLGLLSVKLVITISNIVDGDFLKREDQWEYERGGNIDKIRFIVTSNNISYSPNDKES